MNNNEKLKDEVKNQLHKLKTLTQNLNAQLVLNGEALHNEFDRQKTELNEWLHTLEGELKQAKLENDIKLSMVSSIENLKHLAKVEKVKTKAALKDQEIKINKELKELQKKVDHLSADAKKELNKFTVKTDIKLHAFKSKFDLFKVQAALGAKEVENKWEQKKQEISNSLHTITNDIEKGLEEGNEKVHDYLHTVTGKFEAFKNNLHQTEE